VLLTLDDLGGRTHITMTEEFTSGTAAWSDNPLQQAVMKLRNDWSLDKLKAIVEQRHRMST
jgi:hypothetical protein